MAVKFASREMNALSGNLKSAQPTLKSLHHSVDLPDTSESNLQPLASQQGEISQLLKLYEAVKKGDLKAVIDILDKDKKMVTAKINEWGETAVHVALYEGHVDIAKILVEKNKALLDIKGIDGKLPLQMAASSGKRDMVEYLYEASDGMRGTHTAENKELWTAENRGFVLLECVKAELFDVAQDILKNFPDLARSEGSGILEALASKPRAFGIEKDNYHFGTEGVFVFVVYQYDYGGHADVRRRAMQFLKSILSYFRNSKLDAYEGPANQGNQAVQLLKTILAEISKPELDNILRGFPDQIMNVEMPVEACQKYFSRVLFAAAEVGNTAFIDVLIRQYPKLVLELNDNKQNLFQVAALYHHTGIFKLLGNIGSVRESIYCIEDGNGNTLLHLAATLKETMTQQPNVQMEQAEIWFKMVSDMLPPSLREKKNKAGLTPSELFTMNHKELFYKAVDLEKTTVSGCIGAAVSIIIMNVATVMGAHPYMGDTGPLWQLLTILFGFNVLLGLNSIFRTFSFFNNAGCDFLSLRSNVNSITSHLKMALMLSLSGPVLMLLYWSPVIATIILVVYSSLYWLIYYAM